MPYKANEARRHKIPRARYKVTNWPEYDNPSYGFLMG
jgi:hypothetical protein